MITRKTHQNLGCLASSEKFGQIYGIYGNGVKRNSFHYIVNR